MGLPRTEPRTQTNLDESWWVEENFEKDQSRLAGRLPKVEGMTR